MVNELSKILSSNSKEDILMGDILRVLLLFKRLWSWEIASEVSALRLTLGEEPVDIKEVKRALNKLKKKSLIDVEERFRSDPAGRSVKDLLVSLNLDAASTQQLYTDKRLIQYQEKRYQIFSSMNTKYSRS
ncbi:MAG: hypothetical protein J7K21_02475 [Desulfurococcales archaeon]|nr:hypothetical protein [Desulfurococcales archaeon]